MLTAILSRAFRPRERENVVSWCEKHIEEIPYSPIRGRFSAKNSPFCAPVMEAIADDSVRRVVLSACVQSGKTLAPELTLCYLIANAPGPALWLDVIDDSAKDQSQSRLQPLFENCEPVRALFPLDKNKKRNRAIAFENGMMLWIGGANNKNNLQRRSIRYVFGDETWLWKKDRMKEAEARTSAFGARGKCVFMSQGSFVGDDTARAFEESDAREWMVPCPHCGAFQAMRWKNVAWDSAAKDENGNWILARVRDSVAYRCEHCGKSWANTDKMRAALNAAGKFVATNANPRNGCAGFHWNALSTMDWADLAEEYLNAVRHSRRGDTSSLQVFYQKRMAEPWGVEIDDDDAGLSAVTDECTGYVFGEEWGQEAVFDRERSLWISLDDWKASGVNSAPEIRLRFMTVDVQMDYFYWVVRAWSKEGHSRLVARGMAVSTDDLERARAENGVQPKLLFIDAGFRTQIIKTLCVNRGYTALMGDRRKAFPHRIGGRTVFKPYSPPQVFSGNDGAVGRMFLFSTLATKDTLAEIRAGKTDMRWELPRDIDVKYYKQINAEYFDAEKQLWICPPGKENHFFDCESMQIAAALIGKLIGKDSAAPTS